MTVTVSHIFCEWNIVLQRIFLCIIFRNRKHNFFKQDAFSWVNIKRRKKNVFNPCSQLGGHVNLALQGVWTTVCTDLNSRCLSYLQIWMTPRRDRASSPSPNQHCTLTFWKCLLPGCRIDPVVKSMTQNRYAVEDFSESAYLFQVSGLECTDANCSAPHLGY